MAVAEYGSTSAAARHLNVSQPSISLAITKLETSLGQPLFLRNAGQGLELTAFGARKIDDLRALKRQAGQLFETPDRMEGVLNFGVFSTLGPRYAPSLIRLFQDRYPHTDIRLHEGDLETQFAWLESGRIDMALIYDFGIPSDLAITPLADVRPYGLLPPGHRYADRPNLSLSELLEDPLILVSLPHSRGYFLSLAQMQGISPRIAFETGSIEMLRSMVANGLGVGLLATDIPYGKTYDGGTFIHMPLRGELVPHRIALAQTQRHPETTLQSAFKAHVRAYFTTQSAR
ncbi:LysR family transcriptional regulator [Sneathiella chinensis]|uniref:LysR family transcriptional regulator n=2 Tax=Sneathiella chinensis TaxID=349750 RepID=A0ABQ5U2C1_9PROT|nr:LysR family transcriptional regulator [Sneathiella chinensis]